jgi:N,N'-diacetyllegionaminate synthase
MSSKSVKFGHRTIGLGRPCYLIVEVGTTCMGDINKALQLVAAVKEAGADAVKFQVIDPDQISDDSVTYPVTVNGKTTRVSMKDMFQKLVFDEPIWKRIADEARALGVDFFATVDYLDGVDMLERVGVDVHKIGAWDSTYKQLIEKIGKTGKPMFADLGPTTEQQARDIVDWYMAAGGSAALFMHDFHTQDDVQMNMRAIEKLNEMFPWPAGFSSPAHDDDLDVAALALGAAYLEKRLILSRSDFAFHAHESLEPDELKAWVERIRHVERALGRAIIEPSDKDRAGSLEYYRSVCSLRDIRAGELFSEANIGAKRPGTGIPTGRMDEILGRKAVRDIPKNTLLIEGDFA